jgi:hypothetical protein
METPLNLVLESPTDLWLLIQTGFLIRVFHWEDFYATHKLAIKIYDLIKVSEESKTMANLKAQNPINDGDNIYKDLTTGNYLVIKKSIDTTRVLVVPHV